MSVDWISALRTVMERVERIATDYSSLRSDLRALAQAILQATEEPTGAVDDEKPIEPDVTAPTDFTPPPVEAGNENQVAAEGSPPPGDKPTTVVELAAPPPPEPVAK